MSGRAVVLTVGDPAGVGPEIVLRLLGARTRYPFPITLVSDERLLAAVGRTLVRHRPGMAAAIARFLRRAGDAFQLVQTAKRPRSPRPGKWRGEHGEFIREALDTGIDLAMETGAALVTGPSNKSAFGSGHTEYLQTRTRGDEPLMLFDSPVLRVATLTRHVPLAEVRGRVDRGLLERGVALALDYLAGRGEDPARGPGRPPMPRRVVRLPEGAGTGGSTREVPISGEIVVAGLDPHCGEFAAGSLDVKVREWIGRMRRRGVPAAGPVSADALFARRGWERFAAVLCWYHDQAMIPVKLLAPDDAVNATLGLPVSRFSPAHGVAYDIAWTGRAATGSFHRALLLAGKMII